MSIINHTSADPDVVTEHFHEAKEASIEGGGTTLYLHELSFDEVQVGPEEKTSKIRLISTNPTPLSSVTYANVGSPDIISIQAYLYISDNFQGWTTVRSILSSSIALHGIKGDSATTAIVFYRDINNVVDNVTQL